MKQLPAKDTKPVLDALQTIQQNYHNRGINNPTDHWYNQRISDLLTEFQG
jgi:hypothetical protein